MLNFNINVKYKCVGEKKYLANMQKFTLSITGSTKIKVKLTHLLCGAGLWVWTQRPSVRVVGGLPPRTPPSFSPPAQTSLQRPQWVAASQKLSVFGL